MEDITRSQLEIFKDGKLSVEGGLPAYMLMWDFAQMMHELQRVISSVNKENNWERVRSFTRNYLKLSGQKFKDVQKWISGDLAMTAEEVALVFRTLKALHDGTLVQDESPPLEYVHEETQIDKPKEDQLPERLVRKVVDHTVGSLNSLVGLIVEAGIEPRQVYGSDRMHIQAAMQRISASFGINVVFADSETFIGEPLTRRDLVGVGLTSRKGRRKL